MNRIKSAFDNKKAFIGFVTAGDPNIEKTEEFVLSMAKAGAGIIEIGIPFSDPVAEGETIQKANIRALSNGITTDDVFDLVKRIREKIDLPLAFLTYLNPVFSYGYKRFFEMCKESGVDGIIIPDLPYEEKGELTPFAKENDVKLISLIAPSSDDRIEKISSEAEGFVYCVSSMGVTGVRSEINTNIKLIIEKIKSVTDVPVAVGFGISTPSQAKDMCEFADGVIVGSRIVKIVEEFGENAAKPIFDYVKEMSDVLK